MGESWCVMDAVSARRTLVKSRPELWAQLSDVAELARYLGEFGEIRITRLEAERTVAWEGERARGTVQLEPSGWGTRVTLSAELEAAVPEPSSEVPDPALPPTPPDPPAPPEPDPPLPPDPYEPPPVPPKLGVFARLSGRARRELERHDRELRGWEQRELERRELEQEELERYETEMLEWERELQWLELERRERERRERAAAAAAARPPAAVEPRPEASDPQAMIAVLEAALDGLGAAHHRPFSRG